MEGALSSRTGRHVGGLAGTPGQGPFLAVVLEVEETEILSATFQTYGCPSAVACGRYLTEWLPGKRLADAESLGPGDVAAAVGGLPLGKEFTASLAIEALRHALREAGGE